MAEVKASWTLELYCDCPGCGEFVDLLDDPEFFQTHEDLQPCQHMNSGSRDVEVTCPNCGHEFTVDLEF
jgi:endogenous inhibitor of DNA gyrase (YacG/DUF329 family)